VGGWTSPENPRHEGAPMTMMVHRRIVWVVIGVLGLVFVVMMRLALSGCPGLGRFLHIPLDVDARTSACECVEGARKVAQPGRESCRHGT
jgi:hypothetical protein